MYVFSLWSLRPHLRSVHHIVEFIRSIKAYKRTCMGRLRQSHNPHPPLPPTMQHFNIGRDKFMTCAHSQRNRTIAKRKILFYAINKLNEEKTMRICMCALLVTLVGALQCWECDAVTRVCHRRFCAALGTKLASRRYWRTKTKHI